MDKEREKRQSRDNPKKGLLKGMEILYRYIPLYLPVYIYARDIYICLIPLLFTFLTFFHTFIWSWTVSKNLISDAGPTSLLLFIGYINRIYRYIERHGVHIPVYRYFFNPVIFLIFLIFLTFLTFLIFLIFLTFLTFF